MTEQPARVDNRQWKLEVSSFLGSFGAEHYYVTIGFDFRVQNADGDWFGGSERFEVDREITMGEASKLRKKDSGGFSVGLNQPLASVDLVTHRFNSPEDALSAGKLAFKSVAPEGAWLVDSETGEVLAGVEGEADEAPSSMHYGYGAPASAKTTRRTVVLNREGKIETLDEFFDRTDEASKQTLQ